VADLVAGGIGIGLEWNLAAATNALIRRSPPRRIAVVDAAGERLRRETTEHHEWMAPMRAQASMEIAASGIIGM